MVQHFLKAIIFPDAKRPITKEILMRIDIEKAYHTIKLNEDLPDGWGTFSKLLEAENSVSSQMTLF